MLYAVPDRDPWLRRDDESDDEHALFWLWVRQGTPQLAGDALALARQRDWTSRAQALQGRLDTPANARDCVAATARSIDRILYRAVRKIERQEERSRELTITVRDLRVLLEIKHVLEGVSINAAASTLDLTQLPPSALDELERASEILEGLERKVG